MERRGYYGLKYGGQYMPESLMNALTDVENEFEFVASDGCYTSEMDFFLYQYAGRKTPLYKCRRLTKLCDGADIYLKREDLGLWGSSAFAFIAGQVIIGKRIGRKQVITAAPDLSFALSSASCAASIGLACKIFMGVVDYRKAGSDALRLKALGAQVFVIEEGKGSFFEAKEAAKQMWNKEAPYTIFVEHSAIGPHPYPKMVGELAKIVGNEVKEELAKETEKLPDLVVSALGTGAASLGILTPFIEDKEVKLAGVELEDYSVMKKGKLGIFQGMCSLFLQDEEGNVVLDNKYPGVEPEHVALKESGRVSYETVTREEAIAAFKKLAELEGILPSFESSCALAYAMKKASTMKYEENIVVVLTSQAKENWIEECCR